MVRDAVKGFREAAGDRAEAKETVKVRAQVAGPSTMKKANFAISAGRGCEGERVAA